ncbi:pyroglutamyl-peptidase I [Actinotalea sp. K2]|uniref:pyroglutamyl-peptidase I n=1 Tax=Actinotalea sp. K2 TaxID=2939438 RepID=UPI0020175BAA|nr:pyroglutamyl-peptidase I [Actinotalea sp. K2]MCL3862009.1 pyroglutamyl-peptidase I [Actinotalea sp. K2]
MTPMPTVLVTAFEPFDGQSTNASWSAVEGLAHGWSGPARVVVLRLPVSFEGAPAALRAAVVEHRPALVLCVGEAGGRRAVGVERVAVNLVDAPIADNDGNLPVDRAVVEGGPTAYFSTLPVKACVARILAAGVPAEVSGTAGTYVCNAVFYALMDLLAAAPDVRGGFVHVPRTPAQVPTDGPSLATQAATRALDLVVRTSLERPPEESLRGGATH